MKFEVKNLSCIRGEKYLFRNLSFYLSNGQLLLIQGHNGAGKSSLLKILAGLILPEKGCVYWDTKDITRFSSEYHSHLCYLGHKDGLKKALTPYENIVNNILLGDSHYSPTHVQNMLTTFKLSNYNKTPCQELSAGERRKVALCAILLSNKSLWILDEPFNALDKFAVKIVKHCLMAHLAKGGGIIMVSHIGIEDCQHKILDLSTGLPC